MRSERIDQGSGAHGAVFMSRGWSPGSTTENGGSALRLFVALLLFVALMPAAAWAQSEEEAAASATSEADAFLDGDEPEYDDADEEDGEFAEEAFEEEDEEGEYAGLEELTVTATKRKQSVQDVPISVTALGGNFLQETGTTDFAAIQQFVPNLQILPVTDTRSTSIRIRGIGSVGTNAGIDPSVGVFIDGIYQGRAGMSVNDLLDIERIEVLRGPQGTLYGKNTAAGAINIITRNPTDDFEVFGETVIGNYNAMEFRGSVNGPVVPELLSARVSGYKVLRDGYDVNRFNDERVNDADKYGVRAKLRWTPDERFDIILNGDYSVDASKCCVGDIITYDGPGTVGVTFDMLAAATGTPLPEVDPFDRIVGANVDPLNRVTVGGVALDANMEAGDYDLRWLTAYRTYTSDSQFDGDFSIYDAVYSRTEVDYYQVSSEFLTTSPGGETIDFQAGIYLYYSNLDTDDALAYSQLMADVSAILQDASLNINRNTHETFSAAAFGQATWNIGEAWSLTGGFRVDHERKWRKGVSVSTCGLPVPPVCGPNDVRDDARDVTNPQGTLIGRFRPTDDVMFYASFATGFKSGGFNQLRTSEDVSGQPLEAEFDDEISYNYEIGTKTTWLDNQLLGNLTTYFTDYHDFQAQIFNGSSINVDNAGRMFSWGIEAETRWVPDFAPGWVLGGSLGLNWTQYKEFESAPMTVPQQAAFTGDPLNSGALCVNPALDCSQDLTGRRIDNAPIVSINLFSSYEREIPNTPLVWLASGDYAFESFKYLDTDLDPNLGQDPIHLLNLRTGFKTDDDRIELIFWVQNTLNEQWMVTGSDVPIVSGYWGVNAPPRTYGGTVRFRF